MVSKMLVIKKVSKEDAGFSAGFATAGTLPTNGSKAPLTGSSVYKNLVPKPAVAPTKVGRAEGPQKRQTLYLASDSFTCCFL